MKHEKIAGRSALLHSVFKHLKVMKLMKILKMMHQTKIVHRISQTVTFKRFSPYSEDHTRNKQSKYCLKVLKSS